MIADLKQIVLAEDNANEHAIGFWIDKHNKYASAQAAEELRRWNGAAFLLRPTS